MKKLVCCVIAIIVGLGAIWLVRLSSTENKEQVREDKAVVEKPVVKIGVVYPLSGNAAFFGDGAKNAAKMFFDNFDRAASKYRYELVFEDSQANPARGVMAAKKLIDYDKVDVIVDSFSGVAAAISPITNENKVVHLTFAQDREISKGFYNYRVVTSTQKTGEKMLQAIKNRGYKNVIGVVENAEGTFSLFEGFANAAKTDKVVELKDVFNINPGERDFNIIIQKIKSLQPDVIVVVLQSPEIDIFMKQVQNNSLDIPVAGIQSFSFLKDKPLAEGKWYVDVAYANKEFADEYKKLTGSEVTNFAENFYTILQVITHNYETNKTDGKPSTEEFIKNMKSVNGLKSPLGVLSLDLDEQNVDSEASLRLIENGKIVELKN